MPENACVCCDAVPDAEEVALVHRVWEGRMDNYCHDCALQRCDAYPGQHRFNGRSRNPTPTDAQRLEAAWEKYVADNAILLPRTIIDPRERAFRAGFAASEAR